MGAVAARRTARYGANDSGRYMTKTYCATRLRTGRPTSQRCRGNPEPGSIALTGDA